MTEVRINQKPVLECMIQATQMASDYLVKNHALIIAARSQGIEEKSVVESIDQSTEYMMMEYLSTHFPEVGFEAEESGISFGKDADHAWILDPLDGTANFIRGLPCFGISLALRRGSDIVAAVVANPLMNEMFWAQKQGGAFCNGLPIRVSSCQSLSKAMLSTGTPWNSSESKNSFMGTVSQAIQASGKLRRFGVASVDLAYVACGRYDAYFVTHLSPWDIAAGILLVQEAGGLITELCGGPNSLTSGSVLATNNALHGVLLEILK